MDMPGVRVVAVDVGSLRTGSFAWAAVEGAGEALVGHGADPATAVASAVEALVAGGRAVLALEAPMAVPVPGSDAWQDLGRRRTGEGNRAWSAQAGAAAMGTGLVQAAWMLAEVGRAVPGVAATTQVPRWTDGGPRLLLVEAFVSGTGKPVATVLGQHAADAEAAARAVAERLAGGGGSDVLCAPHRTFNLLAAGARWAGLEIADDESGMDVLVVRARPVSGP